MRDPATSPGTPACNLSQKSRRSTDVIGEPSRKIETREQLAPRSLRSNGHRSPITDPDFSGVGRDPPFTTRGRENKFTDSHQTAQPVVFHISQSLKFILRPVIALHRYPDHSIRHGLNLRNRSRERLDPASPLRTLSTKTDTFSPGTSSGTTTSSPHLARPKSTASWIHPVMQATNSTAPYPPLPHLRRFWYTAGQSFSPPRTLEVVSRGDLGESLVAGEGCDKSEEGEEVATFPLVSER